MYALTTFDDVILVKSNYFNMLLAYKKQLLNFGYLVNFIKFNESEN